MAELRVGVMGCAAIARRAMIPAMRLAEGVRLVAVASRTESKAAQFAREFGGEPVVGYAALLDRDDIDAVYMPLPTGLHPEWIDKALRSGKHLLVEKSFAADAGTAGELLALARQHRCCVMENYLFPLHSQTRSIDQIVAAGELGDLRLVRATFSFPPLPPDNFRYDAALGGGALLDAGGYVLKAAQHFLGPDLTLTAATLETDPRRGVDLAGSATLVGPGEVAAQCYFGFDSYYQCSVELLGTKGKLTAGRFFTPPPDFRPTLQLEWQDRSEQRVLPSDHYYRNMWQHFAATVASGRFDASYETIQRQADYQTRLREVAHG
ncbi:MAG: 1,5-anhydro-D-fructose reductase [Phycisphaerae bacterium]|nr:1,5-anhydro-D-fructose reductase [Phycisphaerae bacterium]